MKHNRCIPLFYTPETPNLLPLILRRSAGLPALAVGWGGIQKPLEVQYVWKKQCLWQQTSVIQATQMLSPLRYLQTNLSLTFNKTRQLLTCEKFPAPCFWWCWHHASYWGFPDLHHACPAPSGKPSTTRMALGVEAFPTLLSDSGSTIRDVKIHEVIVSKLFWIWIQHSLRQVSCIPFSPKGQTGPRSHQALHGLFADLQWWPASARPWKAKP